MAANWVQTSTKMFQSHHIRQALYLDYEIISRLGFSGNAQERQTSTPLRTITVYQTDIHDGTVELNSTQKDENSATIGVMIRVDWQSIAGEPILSEVTTEARITGAIGRLTDQ